MALQTSFKLISFTAVYLDASDACHKVTFDLGSSAGSWSIKVIQYTCGDITGGPDNCMQYFTGTTGEIKK